MTASPIDRGSSGSRTQLLKAVLAGLLLVVATGLAACAGPKATGVLEARADYDTLFSAATASVADIGYAVKTSDKAGGVIIAEQGVVSGEGSTVGLTVEVSQGSDVQMIRLAFVAPPGTMSLGDFSNLIDRYANALRSRVPDVTVVSKQ